MTLPYDRIAQVNIVRYVLGTDIEIVNKGGADNLIIHGLSKSDAERAKLLIEEHIRIAPPASPAVSNSIADEITKLAALRDRNLLTELNFRSKSKSYSVAPDLEASPDHFMGFFETIPLKAKLADGFEHFAAVALGMLDLLNAATGMLSRANQRKGCPVEGGGGGTVDDCAVGCGGLRGGTARD